MLSVIILSYNTCETTLECLSHLAKSKDVDFEILVIDNASTDDSVSQIRKGFPKVRLIENKKNLGFAAGNNQGMRLAKGNKILLLNSDCFVQPDTLSILNSQFSILNWDVVGCKLLNKDGSIQPSFGYFPTLRRIALLMSFIDNFPMLRRFIDSIHVRDTNRYQQTQEVDWVTGAFIMLKTEVFKQVGGIDENYFMYGEEMEWLYRIKQAGFKVWFYPQAAATHLGGASTKSTAKMFLSEMRGYLYWFSKHNSLLEQKLLKIILVVGTFYKAVAWGILGVILGKPDWSKANWGVFKQIVFVSSASTRQQTTLHNV